MLFSRLRKRIEYLREQPESVRLRAATLYTGISGLTLVVIWVAILLPLQIRLNRPAAVDQETAPQGVVSGSIDSPTPTISPALPR